MKSQEFTVELREQRDMYTETIDKMRADFEEEARTVVFTKQALETENTRLKTQVGQSTLYLTT